MSLVVPDCQGLSLQFYNDIITIIFYSGSKISILKYEKENCTIYQVAGLVSYIVTSFLLSLNKASSFFLARDSVFLSFGFESNYSVLSPLLVLGLN